MRGMEHVRASLILLFAAAAPWDVFLFVPGLNVRLTAVLALAIIVLEFVDFLHTRHVGVRFELLWPVCVLLVLALPLVRIVPSHGAMAILLGLAAARSVGPLLARDVVATLAFSIAPLAVYTMVFFFLELGAPAHSPMPSAYAVETGIVMPFGHTVTQCAVLFYIGAAAASSRFLHTNSTSRFRMWALLLLAIPLFTALSALAVFSFAFIRLWRPPDYITSAGAVIAALAGGWLLARIIAKSFVHWREMRYTVSEDLVNILAGLAVFILLFPVEFRLLWGFLPGIAAGAAQSRKDLAPPSRKWAIALIPMAFVVVMNLDGVYPDDTKNPRNYEAAAQQDWLQQNQARLEKRMDFFETYWPEERRTHLWRARVALAEELLHEAAYELTMACQSVDNSDPLLPPPTLEEIDAFLVRLRDACSQSDSATAQLAHIQALLGAGKFKHAEALLEQAVAESGAVTLPEGLDADLETEAYGCPCASWHLREAAMMTVWPVDLKRPSEMEVLFPENAAGAQWLRLLIQWGAELRIPPPEFPNDALPLICIAKCHRSCIELLCISYGGLLGRTDELVDPPKSYDPAARYACFEICSEEQATWEEPRAGAGDSWTVTLRVGDASVATAELMNGIALTSTPPEEPLPAPDAPIIRVWL